MCPPPPPAGGILITMRALAYLYGGKHGLEGSVVGCKCMCVGGFFCGHTKPCAETLHSCWLASCSRCIPAPESPRRLLLGIWPYILQIQGKIWQRFPPFPSPHSHFAERKPPDSPALLPSYLGGLECVWHGLRGLVPHILSPTYIKQFLPGPVLFPFLYLGKRNGEGVLSRRVGPGGATLRTHG